MTAARTLKDNSPKARTEYLLHEWGRWARDHVGAEDYGTDPVQVLISPSTLGYAISDDQAMAINKALRELKPYCLETYEILHSYYKDKTSIIVIADNRNQDRRKTSAIIDGGVNWVAVFLIDCVN